MGIQAKAEAKFEMIHEAYIFRRHSRIVTEK